MLSRTSNRSFRRGFSLANTLLAVAVVSVAAVGTSRLRYYAALDSHRAARQITAARAAELLCESWRAVQGAETYDPLACFDPGLAITQHPKIAGLPGEGGFTELGSYKLIFNNSDYYATLSWKDVGGLRALNVAVAWAERDQGQDDTDSVFQFTAYTTIPSG